TLSGLKRLIELVHQNGGLLSVVLADKLATPLQINQYLTLAFEQAYGTCRLTPKAYVPSFQVEQEAENPP
ncbi:MAG: hypothetical protein WA999_07890, partial [Spirulinaceae cyanobacterium]